MGEKIKRGTKINNKDTVHSSLLFFLWINEKQGAFSLQLSQMIEKFFFILIHDVIILSIYRTGRHNSICQRYSPQTIRDSFQLSISLIVNYEVALYCDWWWGKTSCFSFMTNEPTPTLCVAFAGIVLGLSGIQYTSIKYFGSAWWYQKPSCIEVSWK